MNPTETFELIKPLLNLLGNILESNFFSTCAGALVGAYIAQSTITKLNEKKALNDEIRNVNVAISYALQTANILFDTKKDFCEIYSQYSQNKRTTVEYFKGENTNLTNYSNVYVFKRDLRMLNPISIPIDTLKNILLKNLSTNTKLAITSCELEKAIHTFSFTINMRNDWIKEEESRPRPENDVEMRNFMLKYYGIDVGNEVVNTIYSDMMETILLSNDDGMFYSLFLIEELIKYGQSIQKKLGKNDQKIINPNFGAAIKAGLMPNPKDYETWQLMFRHEG